MHLAPTGSPTTPDTAFLPLRLPPGVDLRRALEEAAAGFAPEGCFVVSGIGSLTIADLRTLLDMAERPAIDADHLASQRAWSEHTFGPGTRLLGVLDHIRKELAEIEAAPQDVEEWVDVIILAFDGAWRAGWEPQQIIDAIKAKQAKNEARTWPDWRSMSADRAIEHIETEARDAE